METILSHLFVSVFFGVIVGLLARRKNRSGLAWGIFGGVSWLLAFIILAFMRYLCPKCEIKLSNKQWKQRICPQCGDISHVEKGDKEKTISRESIENRNKLWIGRSIEDLKPLVLRPLSYASKVGWKETTYQLDNGNWVYVEPEGKNSFVHWEVNPQGTIIGYKLGPNQASNG